MENQDSLHELQELLQETQTLAGVGSFSWDCRTGQLTWTDQLFTLFGVDKQTFTPSFERYLEFLHPDDLERVRQTIESALHACGSFELEERIIRRDGTERVFQTRGRVIADESGRPMRMIGACMDITQATAVLAESRASQARYRALVDHAPDCLFLHDDGGKIIDVNTRACQILGYSREELIGQYPFFINHVLTSEQLQDIINRLQDEESCMFETMHVDRNGRSFPVEVRLTRFRENDTRRAVSLSLDITERRQAEQLREKTELELRESNEKYRIVTESLPQLIWIVRADSTLEYISPLSMEFTGRTLAELSKDWQSLVHPDDLGRVMSALEQALRSSGPVQAEIRALRADGQYRWVLAHSVPIFGQHQQITKWLGAAVDIHDRRIAEEAQQASEDRFRLLLHDANLVVWEADPQTLRFTYVSDYCERMLGFARQKWLEPDFWSQHLHPDDAVEAMEICRHATEAGVDHRMEYRMIAADGGVVWVEDNVHVQVEDGRVVGMRGVIQDISQRKLLEEQLRQAQKMEAVGRLAGGVAHDFNNILTVMMGYSELLLLNSPPDNPHRAALQAINEAGRRAAALTRQLLTFSRKGIVSPKVLDLNELVKRTESLLRPTIGEDIALEIHTDPDVRLIKADRVHIEQVLMNLAINSRDAMPKGGRLTISTSNKVRFGSGRSLDDYIELTVTDTGCGISSDILEKIFDPFFTTKEVDRGTGLGLSVVHGVVTGAGGFIHVESEVGRGTTFRLCFPASPELRTPPANLRNEPHPRGAETILLVEDDRAVRHVTLAHWLSKAIESSMQAVVWKPYASSTRLPKASICCSRMLSCQG